MLHVSGTIHFLLNGKRSRNILMKGEGLVVLNNIDRSGLQRYNILLSYVKIALVVVTMKLYITNSVTQFPINLKNTSNRFLLIF